MVFPRLLDDCSQGLANSDYFVHGNVDDNLDICVSFTGKSLTHLMLLFW